MTNFVKDNTRFVAAKLTTTSSTTVFTAEASNYAQAVSASVANITTTDATVTVQLFDDSASSSYGILVTHTVPANGALNLPLSGLSLDPGDEIRAQAGTANALDVILVVAERPGRSG